MWKLCDSVELRMFSDGPAHLNLHPHTVSEFYSDF